MNSNSNMDDDMEMDMEMDMDEENRDDIIDKTKKALDELYGPIVENITVIDKKITGEFFLFVNTFFIETIKNFVYKYRLKNNIKITDIHKQTNIR